MKLIAPSPLDTPLPASPSFSGKEYVPFGAASNPDELNPALKWWQGASKDSDYKVGERSLTITTGPLTNQVSSSNTAPMVTHPITGNFTAQVMMIFDPSDGQYAGLGVRSVENDTTWLRITRAHDGNGDDMVYSTNDQGNFAYVNQVSYSKDVVHLRIVRVGKAIPSPKFQMTFSTAISAG